MKGKVKFFNQKKGFGFITGDDGNDYYVHATAILHQDKIQDADIVSFTGDKGPKGLIAKGVTATSSLDKSKKSSKNRNKRQHHQDDRISCPNCTKKIIPRFRYKNSYPVESLCPYCAHIIEKLPLRASQKEGIFILVVLIFFCVVVAITN